MREIYKCPVCGAGMAIDRCESTAVCPAGHSFDRARQGYFNLLRAGTRGDNRIMTEARRRFLEKGHYRPLADAVAARAAEGMCSGGVLLDAGCGTGYYTDLIQRTVSLRYPDSVVVGIDISREAVRAAAVINRSIIALCAGVYDMPLMDGVVRTAVNVSSPLADAEYRRVIAPGGYLILVCPGRRHLFGLKRVLYDDPYENEERDDALPGFDILSLDRIRFDLRLQNRDAEDLLAMTPYFYRTGDAGRARLAATDTLETEAEFRLIFYRRT